MVCPQKVIFEEDSEKGILEGGYSGNIEFWKGTLTVGEVAPTSLIKALKKKIDNKKIVIIDSSPGTSCPFGVLAIKDNKEVTVKPEACHDCQVCVQFVSIKLFSM